MPRGRRFDTPAHPGGARAMRVPGYLLGGAPGIPVRRLVRADPSAQTCDDALVAARGDLPGDRDPDQQPDQRPDQRGGLPGDSAASDARGPAGRHRTPRSSRVAAAAFLRVYEPVADGFAPPAAGQAPPGGAEHAAALRAASALPPRVVGDLDLLSPDDDATAPPALPLWPPAPDGLARMCPIDLSKRVRLALEEFQHSVQPEVLSAFLPAETFAPASTKAGRRASHTRGRAPHIRSCAWHVPLPWLAPFGVEGRQRRPLCFQAAMADARRDLARALAVVRRTPTDFLPTRRLEDVGRWLEEFHPRSVVELDYGGLLPIVSDDEAGDANSVALMRAAIAAIRAGSTAEGLAGLAALRDRWASVRAFERAN